MNDESVINYKCRSRQRSLQERRDECIWYTNNTAGTEL